MRASNVRPGALVWDDAGRLQVVVKVERVSYRHYAIFANGNEEEWGPDENVNVVKLTDAQIATLDAIRHNEMRFARTPGGGFELIWEASRRPVRESVSGALARYRLVVWPDVFAAPPLTARLTELGRAYLDALKTKES